MSFVKGKFYKCVKATYDITVGNVYECEEYHCTKICIYIEVIGNSGKTRSVLVSCFDPTPVNAPSASHGSAATRVSSTRDFISTHLAKQDTCSCGKQPVKKDFLTFSYLYCEACKKEVGGKAEAAKSKTATEALKDFQTSINHSASIVNSLYGASVNNASQQQALPPGVRALKGEVVTCATCSLIQGTLQKDLCHGSSVYTSVVWEPSFRICCSNSDYYNIGKDSVHIEGRGWV